MVFSHSVVLYEAQACLQIVQITGRNGLYVILEDQVMLPLVLRALLQFGPTFYKSLPHPGNLHATVKTQNVTGPVETRIITLGYAMALGICH